MLVLDLQECLVEYATVCFKSEVILDSVHHLGNYCLLQRYDSVVGTYDFLQLSFMKHEPSFNQFQSRWSLESRYA